MCNYCITTNQAAISRLFRVNRYVGNLAPMPGRVSKLSGSGDAQLGRRTRNDDDALGHAAAEVFSAFHLRSKLISLACSKQTIHSFSM
jgi:hypothetical protein